MDADLAEIGIEVQTLGAEEALQNLDKIQKKGKEIHTEFSRIPSIKPNDTGYKNLLKEIAPLWDIYPELEKIGLSGAKLGTGIGRVLGSAFEKFLTDGGAASDLLGSLEKDFVKLGEQLLGLSGQSGSLRGGASSAIQSVAGNFLTNLFPGFASGGQFTVGGAAGQDRNLVGLRLSRGERVSVETPKMQKEKGGTPSNQNVSLSFNITTPNAESFRRSQSQIQGEALRSAQRILKRNG